MATRPARSRSLLVPFLVLLAAACRQAPAPGPATASVARGGAIVSSIRGEPRTFNRLAGRDSTTETISQLTQARLVRINRATQDLEPWLAERWSASSDSLAYTLALRSGVRFSDGTPFTSEDVLFSFKAAYDEKSGSAVGETLRVAGKPLQVSAPDPATVVVRFPSRFGPGLRLLDGLPILPRHRLQRALDQGALAKAWGPATPPAEMCGLGPFVLREYQAGQRLVFDRNPHYWRKDATGAALPYLDRVTLEIVPDQNAELLRLGAGQLDCTQSEVRPEDYATLKRAQGEGKVRIADLGVGLDADSLWFNLKPAAKPDPRHAWLRNAEFRRAVSHAVDRAGFADTVFLGAGVPVYGPISPANRFWHWPGRPTEAYDPSRARALLGGLGLADRNGDGVLEDRGGRAARFTLLTQKGNTALERGASVIKDSLEKVGIGVDVVALDVGALIDRIERSDYEAIYFRFLMTDLDPAVNREFWLSSGAFHVWNPAQARPATEWEARIDALMEQQATTLDLTERQRLFQQVQQVLGEQLPILYFAAPRVFVATSARLRNATPALIRPMVLWSADTLAVAGATAGST